MGVIKDGTLGYGNALILLITVLTSKIYLTAPRSLVEAGLTAAWMIPWLNLITLLITFIPALLLMKRYPSLNLVEIAERVGGALTGIIISVVLFLYFFTTSTLIMRQFTETVATVLLPRTPLSVITVTFILGVAYGVYQGIEAIARKTTLLKHFVLLSLLGLLLFSLRKAHLDYLFPFWGPGLPKLLKTGASVGNPFIIILLMLNPYIRERSKLTSLFLSSNFISQFIFSAVAAIYVMSFDVRSAITGGAFPLYNMARALNFGRYIQRLESVFILIWVLVLLASVSALVYAGTVSLATGLRLPCYRPLIFPLMIIVFAVNFTIPNFPTTVMIDSMLRPIFWWAVAVFIPTAIWLLSLLRERGGQTNAQKQQEDT